MASIRKATLLVAAAVLLLAAVAEAGLMCPRADVVRGTIASYERDSGRLVVGGRTLHVTPQTALQRRVGNHYEPLLGSGLAPGQEVRAVGVWVNNRCLARSVDVLERVNVPSQAK